MRRLLTLFALAASLGALPARAQSAFPPPPAPDVSGPYFGGQIGRSQAKSGCLGFLSGGGRSCDDTDRAWGLFAGFQLSRFFGVEGAFNDLGKVKASSPTRTETTHASLFEVAALGIVPVDEQVSLYGKFGGYRAKLESSERGIEDHSNSGITYGGGLQWGLPRGLGVRGQWQRYKDVGSSSTLYGVNTYDVFSVALLWRLR